MSYSGYLIKVGGTILPNSVIKYETYNVTPFQAQDLDSSRMADGSLERNVVDKVVSDVTFNTIPMTDTQMESNVMSILRANWNNDRERKLKVTYWSPMHGDYKTDYMYMPDIQFPIKTCMNEKIIYDEVTLEFIGYGEST